MLTARNVFSNNFAASATRAELTLWTARRSGAYNNAAASVESAEHPPTTFGMLSVAKTGIARINPFGRERQQKVRVQPQARRLEERQQNLVGGARIGR